MVSLSRDFDQGVEWRVCRQEPAHLMGWIRQHGGTCVTGMVWIRTQLSCCRGVDAGKIPRRIIELETWGLLQLAGSQEVGGP